MKRYTQLKGKTGGEVKGNTSTLSSLIRYETLAGRDYLVSPVVMIVGDTVVQGANAENPELVTLACLENSHLKGFDGRPIVPGHPYNGKEYTSANLPEVFNSQQCGILFNTGLNGKNLGSEIYLDIDRCESLGGDASDSLTALQEGRSIDVSIGVYFESVEESGELDGQEYHSIWTEIWADHLALLPNGQGACNQNMGCGTPRVADSLHKENTMSKPSLLSRLLSRFRVDKIFDDGDPLSSLQELIVKAMRKIDPAFDWVSTDWIYPDAKSFIYSTYMIMGGTYESVMKFYRRTYELSSDGKSITINNDAVEVEPAKQMWETKNGEETIEEPSTAPAPLQAKECSCQQKENKMEVEEKKEEMVVNSNATPTNNAPTSTLPLTEAQVLEAFPDLKQIVTLHRTQQASRKSELVTKLLTVQQVYNKEQLETKDVAALEEIAQLVQLTETQQPVDYSFRGAAAVDPNPTTRKLPDPWKLNKQAAS